MPPGEFTREPVTAEPQEKHLSTLRVTISQHGKPRALNRKSLPRKKSRGGETTKYRELSMPTSWDTRLCPRPFPADTSLSPRSGHAAQRRGMLRPAPQAAEEEEEEEQVTVGAGGAPRSPPGHGHAALPQRPPSCLATELGSPHAAGEPGIASPPGTGGRGRRRGTNEQPPPQKLCSGAPRTLPEPRSLRGG